MRREAMKRIDTLGRFALGLALLAACATVPLDALAKSATAEEQCAKLAAKAAQDTNKKDRVDQATIVSATWTPASATLPAHCLVLGYVTTGDKRQGFNHVNIKGRLPESWNSKFYLGGNGGVAGSFPAETNVAPGPRFATRRTATGHPGG